MSVPNVVTMKWGKLYSAQYVNVLFRACRTASTQPFQFICMTDDATDLDPAIIAKPLPPIALSSEDWYRSGVWGKLALYAPRLFDLTGRCVFIDLDMIVLRDLDAFFNFEAPFVSIDVGKAWHPIPRQGPPEVGTGIFAFDIGAQSQIMSQFEHDPEAVMQSYKTEQAFVGDHATGMAFWPHGWVISFKRWLRQPIGKDLFFAPKAPPESAKIIAFHGDPRPADLMHGGIWDRFPHMGHGKVGWAADYWTRFGGTIEISPHGAVRAHVSK